MIIVIDWQGCICELWNGSGGDAIAAWPYLEKATLEKGNAEGRQLRIFTIFLGKLIEE